MIIKSCSKINLSLQITGVREDGYHTLDMVELPLDLHDVLEVTKTDSVTCHITSDAPKVVKFKDNLCKKAIDALNDRRPFDENVDIFIHKVIPFAAGLGGGSSNCASTLIAANNILKLNFSEEELINIGLSIGADVPFFFLKKPARVTGIGEILEPINFKKDYYVVVIKPEKGCSSKEIYSLCDKYERKPINNNLVIEGLIKGDEDLIANNIGNDLLEAAKETNDQIQPCLDELKNFGFKIVSMSGSGSSCFALSLDKSKCAKAYRKLIRNGYDAYFCKLLF